MLKLIKCDAPGFWIPIFWQKPFFDITPFFIHDYFVQFIGHAGYGNRIDISFFNHFLNANFVRHGGADDS